MEILLLIILIVLVCKKSGEKIGQTIVNKKGWKQSEEVKDENGLTLTA